mgnify:CR=1 FL=1
MTSTKTAAKVREVLNNLSPKVIEKASVVAVSRGLREKAFKAPVQVKVKDYTVTFSLSGEESDPHIKIRCTCPAWTYQGSEYHANKEDYLLGEAQGTLSQPTTRDPNGEKKVCKHVYGVLKSITP